MHKIRGWQVDSEEEVKGKEKLSNLFGRHIRSLPKGKSVSAFPSSLLPTPLRNSNSEPERRGEQRRNGPLHGTAMDTVIKAAFASLSLTAMVAHRLAASSDVNNDKGVDHERDELKRKAYTALRNRYFGAYFCALFGTTNI